MGRPCDLLSGLAVPTRTGQSRPDEHNPSKFKIPVTTGVDDSFSLPPYYVRPCELWAMHHCVWKQYAQCTVQGKTRRSSSCHSCVHRANWQVDISFETSQQTKYQVYLLGAPVIWSSRSRPDGLTPGAEVLWKYQTLRRTVGLSD